MSFQTKLKDLGGIITAVLSFGYVAGFVAAIINYSQICEWLATSSILGLVSVTLFQLWVWITGFVLLYLTIKRIEKVTGTNRKRDRRKK